MPTSLSGMKLKTFSVLRESHKVRGNVYWICRCECGAERALRGDKLLNGFAACIECGRGRSPEKTPPNRREYLAEYSVWSAMIQRCSQPNNVSYANYGGRGISVCARWRRSFKKFLEDMGRRPSRDHSIDRINNDGNYEPGNCRWATRKEQASNKRRPQPALEVSP